MMLRTMLHVVLAVVLGCVSGCGNGSKGEPAPPPAPPAPPSLAFARVLTGLTSPTAIVHAGDGSNRLFIVELSGRVRVVRDGTLLTTPFLDIADRLVARGEQGLLGLAFPPDFAQKGYFYVDYTRAADGATVVSRFFVSASPDLALPASEEVLLVIPQPFANHNGGQLAFGPDGFLYLGLGDGGSGGDPLGHAQNPASLLGKLLRLDVESGVAPYAIPLSNPYLADPGGADEIWATGLRNPWRFSFDRLTGDLYVADVGQGLWEEINVQDAASAGGENYGWNVLEGPACFNPVTDCTLPPDYVPPVAFYGHELGCSVTGGYVYRGPENPGLQGLYLYGDFCSGRLWGLARRGGIWENTLLADTVFSISTFGEDESGRIYLADYATGEIYRIDQQ